MPTQECNLWWLWLVTADWQNEGTSLLLLLPVGYFRSLKQNGYETERLSPSIQLICSHTKCFCWKRFKEKLCLSANKGYLNLSKTVEHTVHTKLTSKCLNYAWNLIKVKIFHMQKIYRCFIIYLFASLTGVFHLQKFFSFPVFIRIIKLGNIRLKHMRKKNE